MELSKMKYLIVWGTDMDKLEKHVNEMIREGYRPQGGIVVSGKLWAQAMVKGD